MTNSVSSYDVAIVGLGAMGAAALYQFAKRGMKVVGIDQFTPPHDRGSTHGETRITRQAVGEGEAYVPLVLRANEIWQELEAETGEKLLTRSGCLILGSPENSFRDTTRAGFLTRTLEAAKRFAIPHEVLDAAEVRNRYPQFAPRDDEMGYFEPGGGHLNPEACVAAQLGRARALGAAVQLDTKVLSVEPQGSGVRIVTDRGKVSVGQVVVSAGAWAPALLGASFDRLLAPSRQVMHWFPVAGDSTAKWTQSPVFIWSHGPGPSDSFYGFPALPGTSAIKTAGEQYEATTDPDKVERDVGAAESRAMYEAHLAGRLKGLGCAAAKAVTCLYTVTPDSDFLIDRHPEHERILVVSPCSGHGFKHSAAIGEVAAQIVTEGRSRIDVSAFRLSRFQNVV